MEDPVLRAGALRRLEQLLEDKRDPALVDRVIEPMTSCYSKGGLAEIALRLRARASQ